jgi:hypothetical protein
MKIYFALVGYALRQGNMLRLGKVGGALRRASVSRGEHSTPLPFPELPPSNKLHIPQGGRGRVSMGAVSASRSAEKRRKSIDKNGNLKISFNQSSFQIMFPMHRQRKGNLK